MLLFRMQMIILACAWLVAIGHAIVYRLRAPVCVADIVSARAFRANMMDAYNHFFAIAVRPASCLTLAIMCIDLFVRNYGPGYRHWDEDELTDIVIRLLFSVVFIVITNATWFLFRFLRWMLLVVVTRITWYCQRRQFDGGGYIAVAWQHLSIHEQECNALQFDNQYQSFLKGRPYRAAAIGLSICDQSGTLVSREDYGTLSTVDEILVATAKDEHKQGAYQYRHLFAVMHGQASELLNNWLFVLIGTDHRSNDRYLVLRPRSVTEHCLCTVFHNAHRVPGNCLCVLVFEQQPELLHGYSESLTKCVQEICACNPSVARIVWGYLIQEVTSQIFLTNMTAHEVHACCGPFPPPPRKLLQ